MSKPRIQIHKSEMSEEMQREALQVALLAENMYTEDTDIAVYISAEFKRWYGGTWHCIVGNCGYVVQQTKYIEFTVGNKKITLFKSD